MMNVVTFKAPKFKPMPGELTPAVINGATLPVKIGIAQRAIAACCDLSELLTWKDKLAALAAAAKMARMPEMARDVNRVHKEAIFRMGELLLQYKGTATGRFGKIGGTVSSDRVKASRAAGIPDHAAAQAARLAAAPKDVIRRLIADDKIPSSPAMMARLVPRQTNNRGNNKNSNAAMQIFQGVTPVDLASGKSTSGTGLAPALRALRVIDMELIAQLTPEEIQRARKYIVEAQEILDEIDRRLGPDTSVKSCN